LRRFAVISDIHANLEALEEVLRMVEGMELYCLGDFVDYGADPNEVVELLRDKEVRAIMGNHDAAALTGDTSQFNPRAAMSSIWTAGRLTPASREYLRALPEELRVRFEKVDIYFTHGSPDDRLWEYVDPRTHSDLFGYYLDRLGVQLIGLGHTHVPYVWKEGRRIVFNPGSVGQPRDLDRRAAYAQVTVEGSDIQVKVKRVEYDVGKAASRIRAAGLPESFAERLSTGS